MPDNSANLLGIQNALDRGVQSLSGIPKIFEELEAKNEAKDVLAYIQALQNIDNPDGVKENQNKLDIFFSKLNPANAATYMGAKDARVISLRKEVGDTATYLDDVRTRKEAPINELIDTDIASKNYAGALERIGANPNLRNAAKLTAAINLAKRTDAEQLVKDNLAAVNNPRLQAEAEYLAANLPEKQRQATELLSQTGALQTETGRNLPTVQAQARFTLADTTRIQNEKADTLDITDSASVASVDAETIRQGHIKKYAAVGMPVVNGEIQLPKVLTESEQKQWDAWAKSQGIPPMADLTYKSNTNAMRKYIRDGIANGTLTEASVARNLDLIRSKFDTTREDALVGTDADAADLVRAKKDEVYKAELKNNWFKPGTTGAKEMVDELNKEFKSIYGDASKNPETANEAEQVMAMFTEIARDGILIGTNKKTGKESRIVPSKVDLLAAFTRQSADNNWDWWDKDVRANKVKSWLTTEYQKSSNIDRIAEAEKTEAYGIDMRAREAAAAIKIIREAGKTKQ